MPAILLENAIDITFLFDWNLVNRVKTLPDRAWNKATKSWRVPATNFHAQEVIKTLTGYIEVDQGVHELANRKLASLITPSRIIDSRLYPFQQVAVDFLIQNDGRGMICDEMGLGKTIEALAYCRQAFVKKILVVAPASVLFKWQKEAEIWLPSHPSRVILSGKDPILHEPMTIMSYDIMTRKIEEILGFGYDTIIFDECHRLKNHKAIRTKAALTISRGVPHVIGLTGTPVLNYPLELFSMLKVFTPSKFPSWKSYTDRYCLTPENGYRGAKNLEELSERLKDTMVRRLKTDVLQQLPSLTRIKVPLMPSKDDFVKYRQAIKEAGNDMAALTSAYQEIGKVKSIMVKEIVDEIVEVGHKVILYVVHKSVASYLEMSYADRCLKIVGDVPVKERQGIVELWQEDPHYKVMIISRAGGEGIDLFSAKHNASRMIFVEREWVPATEEQAESRIHRMGQEFPVEIMYPMLLQTMDEDMDAVIETKRSLANTLVRVNEFDVKQEMLDKLRGIRYAS